MKINKLVQLYNTAQVKVPGRILRDGKYVPLEKFSDKDLRKLGEYFAIALMARKRLKIRAKTKKG